MSCPKLGAFCLTSMPRKEGKHRKKSLPGTSRMIFLLSNTTHSNYRFWLPRRATVTVKQQSMLPNVKNSTQNISKKFKTLQIFKNGHRTRRMANFYSREVLLLITHSLWRFGEKNQKPVQNNLIGLVVVQWRCFIRWPCAKRSTFKWCQEWLSYTSLTVVLRILQSDWPGVFLTPPNYNFSNHLLSSFNLHQHTKNFADWPNCFRDMAYLWILKSDCPGAFSPMEK